MELTTPDSLTTTLITLLDQHNTLKGLHIFAHPARPETTLPLPPTDGTPIAIQMNKTPSLATHLLALQTETQTLQTLLSKIHTFLKTHPTASPATHAHLNTTYGNLVNNLTSQQRQTTLSTAKFAALTDLSTKLALLRQTQHHTSAPQLQRPAEFVTNLVADVDSVGRPDPMLKLYLPVEIDWPTYEQALTVNTHRRWTYDFGYDGYDDEDEGDGEEGDGMVQFPTFQDDGGGGGFVFQRTSSSGRAEPISRSLTNEAEFRGMLGGTGKGEWGGNVLVWSARVFEASQTARKVEKEARRAGAESGADFEGVGVEGVDFGSP